MGQALTGALAMGFGIAGLFFLRFWRDTRDRLFLFFAVAFFLQSGSRIGLINFDPRDAHGDFLYWIRLLAFAMILLAVIDKNMSRDRFGY